jgi:hypothetical protein
MSVRHRRKEGKHSRTKIKEKSEKTRDFNLERGVRRRIKSSCPEGTISVLP